MKTSNIEFSWNDTLQKEIDFNKFINWLSAEFVLNQQEDALGIKIYFPNGWFLVHSLKKSNNEYEVFIHSKSKISFTKIKEQLLLAIYRFKKINVLYSF